VIMKKIVAFLCFTVFSVFSICAQNPSSSIFRGGVRAGLVTSQISGDNLSGFHKLGGTAGLFATVPLSRNSEELYMQIELDFTMKGSKSRKISKTDNTGKYVLNLGYLEVPVLLRWKFAHITINGNSGFEVEFGPMFGVNIYAQERDVYGVIPGRPQFSRFEFCAVGGLSYMFDEHHGLNLRFSNSVFRVRTPNWAVNRPIFKQYNSALAFCYFYQF